MSTPVEIAPARGRLGVLLVGLGAVSTTTIAGVVAIRKGLAKPIGSLTQMGTVRLGKRTEGRSPHISDVVPLAGLGDLVFGGWDIFEEDCYAAARTAGVDLTGPCFADTTDLHSRYKRGDLRSAPGHGRETVPQPGRPTVGPGARSGDRAPTSASTSGSHDKSNPGIAAGAVPA